MMRRRVRKAHAALAGLAVLALCAVVLVSGKIGVVSLETFTYNVEMPEAPSAQTYSYTASMPGDNTYTYNTAIAAPTAYSYTTAVAPTQQTFTYNTEAAVAPSSFSYTTSVAAAPDGYTYTAAPEAAVPTGYTYTTNGGGGPALYTYDASAGSSAPLSTYNAQEVNSQMTTINGYVQDKPKEEQWWNVPMGELHPLDTAGQWNLASVNSVNPDSTARSWAPLTLTGERADGTVASQDSTRPPEEARLSAARTEQLLQLPSKLHPETFNALAVAQHAHLSKKRLASIYKTPVSEVRKLTAEERKLWASHVILQAKKRQRRSMVDKTPVAQVKLLPKKEQLVWAKDVLKESKIQWANSASRLVARSGGMSPQTAEEMASDLRSNRPCGILCQKRAVSSARNMLPTSDDALGLGLAGQIVPPRMPVN